MAPMSDAEWRAAIEHAVKQRFPEKGLIIDRLLGVDENFREMCEELAEIDRAIQGCDAIPPRHRQQAVGEWGEWRGRLVAEIEEALAHANVIPMKPGKSSSKR